LTSGLLELETVDRVCDERNVKTEMTKKKTMTTMAHLTLETGFPKGKQDLLLNYYD